MMMVEWAVRSLMTVGVASLLVSLPGDGPHRTASQGLAPASDPGIVRLSEREWRLSRAGMILRMTREFVPIFSFAEREVTPLYEGERMVGYQLGDVERCAFYRDLGFRDGDIIRSVNGEPLQSLHEMYLRFRFLSQADVAVERRGRLMTLRYWIN